MSAPDLGGGQQGEPGSDRSKTRLCRHWERTGRCNHGANCGFAHGPNELRGGAAKSVSFDVVGVG